MNMSKTQGLATLTYITSSIILILKFLVIDKASMQHIYS